MSSGDDAIALNAWSVSGAEFTRVSPAGRPPGWSQYTSARIAGNCSSCSSMLAKNAGLYAGIPTFSSTPHSASMIGFPGKVAVAHIQGFHAKPGETPSVDDVRFTFVKGEKSDELVAAGIDRDIIGE